MNTKECDRVFDDESRFVTRSFGEIREAMEDETIRLRRKHALRLNDRPWSLTATINAVLVGYLRLSEEERDRLTLDGLSVCLTMATHAAPYNIKKRHKSR